MARAKCTVSDDLKSSSSDQTLNIIHRHATHFITIKINHGYLRNRWNPIIIFLSKDKYGKFVLNKKFIDDCPKEIRESKMFKEWLIHKFNHLGVNSVVSLRYMHDNILHGSNGWITDIHLKFTLKIDDKFIKEFMIENIHLIYMNGVEIKRLINCINFIRQYHLNKLPELHPEV